jgi:hypothetical protein
MSLKWFIYKFLRACSSLHWVFFCFTEPWVMVVNKKRSTKYLKGGLEGVPAWKSITEDVRENENKSAKQNKQKSEKGGVSGLQ